MSGPSEDYDPAEEAALAAALDAAWAEYDPTGLDGSPTRMRVEAEIEWAGEIVPSNGGVRTVNFSGLDLDGVAAALAAARKADHTAANAGSRLTATDWHDQLTALIKSPRGQSASDRAGLSPTRETLYRWMGEHQTPGPANMARIHSAYTDMRGQLVSEARGKAAGAHHAVAEAMNHALQQEYGSEIRLRRIVSIELED